MTIRQRALAGVLVLLVFSNAAFATCGDVSGDDQVSAADALTVLKVAVGQEVPLNCSCTACGTSVSTPSALAHCADVSGGVQVTAADALTVLKSAVGQAVQLNCSCEACQSATTTTTIPSGCPPESVLDDLIYVEKYTCGQTFTGGGEPFCESNISDNIGFNHVGGGEYEVRDVPDTGFVLGGTLDCRTFTWVAESPGEYEETGTWEFSNDLSTFSGSSSYTALDNSYTGNCNETGIEWPDHPTDPPPEPADPPPVSPCP